MPKRCLVVGAGSSGLSAIQQALDAGLDVVAVEARAGVGGAWRYDADPGECRVDFDEHGSATLSSPWERVGDDHGPPPSPLSHGPPPPSPMYSSLRTNVPTALMQYRGYPFPGSVPLFCSHEQVQSYLESFSQPLLPYIRFNTRLTRLRYTAPEDGGAQLRWYAETQSTLSEDAPVEVEQFDAVMVCNGHYSQPYIPWTDGLDSFEGKITHARWYRDAKALEDKTVLVVGNSASGYDITRELASSIYDRRQAGQHDLPRICQASRSPPALGIPFDSPESPEYGKEVGLYPPIKKIEGKKIEFEDGRSVEDVDVILFATGYLFSFPFVSPSDAPFSSAPLTYTPPLPDAAPGSQEVLATTEPAPRGEPSRRGGLRLHNLDDRMLFYLPDTTLAFVGLPYLVIPFPLAQLQARLAALHFASSPRLPAPLTFVPDPSARRPPSDDSPSEGPDDSAPETRKAVTWGHPKQYDMHDRWLRETGDVKDEDGLEGRRKEDGEEEPHGGERDLRMGAKGLRKAVLGY
ncbi:monooxygenase [Rhodosporidiobolus nylandii]